MVLIGLNAITKELVLACRQLGLVVSETLASFVASTIVNPADGAFFVEKNLEENDARAVVEESVKRLFGSGKPGMESLKLQASYETSFFEIERKSQAERKQRAGQEERIVDTILGSNVGRLEDFDAMTQLYRRIYQLLLLRCGSPVGAPGSGKKGQAKEGPALEREVAAALESVFPRVGLRSFVALTGPEKTAQLQELCNIVLGIRLFNKQLGKGGLGLPPIEAEETEKNNSDGKSEAPGAEQTLQALENEIGLAHAACRVYTDHITLLVDAKKTEGKDFEQAREELYYRRQHLAYLLSLQDDISNAQERRAADIEAYKNEMLELDALVGARTSVPKDQVYPRFDTVARIYLAAYQETRLLRERFQLFELLQKHKQTYHPRLADEKAREAQAHRAQGAFDVDAAQPAAGEVPAAPADPTGEGPVKLTLENTPDFLQLPLDFQGFCIAALANSSILCPGNPALGVVKYKGRYCVFASEAALNGFLLNPEKYFVGVREVCYRSPCLIHLLRLHEDFPKSSLIGILQGQAGHAGLSGAVVQADASTETPTHFVEMNIDKSYEWNEWAMRRDALHLADIRQKKTNSTQTLLSSIRRESETQVYLPKDAATNTGVEQGTNPERWRTYVTGLRGAPDTEMKTVNLKFEL